MLSDKVPTAWEGLSRRPSDPSRTDNVSFLQLYSAVWTFLGLAHNHFLLELFYILIKLIEDIFKQKRRKLRD